MPARAPAAVPAAVPAALVGAAALFAVVLFAAVFLAGCSQPATILGVAGDVLVPGTTVAIDLDGDATDERVLLEKSTRRLTITDGSIVYHSRGKWQVVEASLGDTDRNALPDVVALLDASDGRHLGLFAYVGGKYRERLVTSVLRPRPLSLRVVAGGGETDGAGDGGAATGPGAGASAGGGDLLVLTEEAGDGQAGTQTTTYRWNGFGFTALDAGASQ